jgi:hypothetical protein
VSASRAVLDADIVFSRVLHELMGRLATGARLFDLVWIDELLDEAKSSLMKRKGLSADAAEAWVSHMRREFPNGGVDLAGVSGGLDLPSMTRGPGDVHVCSLAIAGSADLLFTFDRGYLKEPLREHGVEVPDVDRFLIAQCKEQPQAMARIVEAQADVWSGGRPLEELLVAFERANVSGFASALRSLLDVSG